MIKPYVKAVVSNKYVEVTQQPYRPYISGTSSGGRKSFSIQSNETNETNLKISINRARKNIARLLECNFTETYAFLTLTFKQSEEADLTDIKTCLKLFSDFKKRLAYYLQKNQLPAFKYLGVTEFQDENEQGAVHFHLVCNLIHLPLSVLEDLWENGFLHRKIIKSNVTDNGKIAHYLKKGITDKRLTGKKKYFSSHGLKKPLTFEIEDPEEFYNALNKCQPTLLFDESYPNPFSGETKYEHYHIDNPKELINYVQDL